VQVNFDRHAILSPSTGAKERIATLQGQAANLTAALQLLVGSIWQGSDASLPAAAPLAISAVQVHKRTVNPCDIQVRMVVPGRFAGAILGKDGSEVKSIASSTGCLVTMTRRDASDDRRVIIIGQYPQCAAAQGLVHELHTKAAVGIGQEVPGAIVIVFVPKSYVGAVIGQLASNLKHIREDAGIKLDFAITEVESHRLCTMH